MLPWRNELKFVCTDAELAVLRVRLKSLLPMDEHQDGDCYRIRSLYFDDLSDNAVAENAAGIDSRKKYRIRYYNDGTDRLRLEIKSKLHNKCHKDSCKISRERCDALLSGNLPQLLADDPAPLRELTVLGHTRLLQPRVIIEYERTAFVHPVGNVRITFDRNITACDRVQDFYEPYLNARPLQAPGVHVLEVKYDEFLPNHIAQALELSSLRQSSFSKYYLGRFAVLGGQPS